MTTRRELMQGGTALAIGVAAPLRALARAESAARWAPLVIVDHAVADAPQFATAAAARGAAVRALRQGDIGALWMNEIEPRWRTGRGAIAGLTAGGPLFCLELFARDYGMCVAYRARHTLLASGNLAHVVADADAQVAAGALDAAGERWSAVAAALAVLEPAVEFPRTQIPLLDLAEDEREVSFYSWMLAPRPRSHY
jgi:hypothetical protein